MGGPDPFLDIEFSIIFRIFLNPSVIHFVTLDLEWCPTEEFTIQQNNLLGVLPEWGPAWKISFELYILSFPPVSDWFVESILRFTSTTNNCCSIGDRIPALFIHSNHSICYYTTIIDGEGDNTYSPSIQTGKWYSFEIEQHLSEDQVKMGI